MTGWSLFCSELVTRSHGTDNSLREMRSGLSEINVRIFVRNWHLIAFKGETLTITSLA
jgi:hypothetical protein